MRESLTLPASMRPLEAAYVNGRFSFTFDSIYTYGEGLASLGTYAPVSNDTGGQWFCFDRNPLCAPAWCGGNLVVKSTRTVAGVNLSTREDVLARLSRRLRQLRRFPSPAKVTSAPSSRIWE